MSLWLCRQEQVSHPFYVENLGIHLYSSQELSYIIYQYPLLVMDGFVEDGLLEFLREDLNLGFLALKLEKWMASHEDPDEMLAIILQECDYYTSSQISSFRQKLATLRKKHPAEFRKMKADELFSLHQYGRAAELYQELLDVPKDSYVDDKYQARIWYALGSCHARLFRLSEAFEAYERAYNKVGLVEILKNLYCLTKLDDRLKLGERLSTLVTEELKAGWDESFEQARQSAAASDAVAEIDRLFEKDSIRRQAGAAKLVSVWKEEYRSMA